MKKVFIALRMAGEAGQGKLAGIYRYLNEHRLAWDIRLIESTHELTRAAVKEAIAARTDGYIISLQDEPGGLDPLAASERPTVIMDLHEHLLCTKPVNTVFIRNDAHAIAQAAFDHFDHQARFCSYVYLPAKENEDWSKARGAAFAECAERRRIAVHIYSGDIPLPDFLKSLPGPVAIFAATDVRASEVLQAAKIARLAIPARLAVIGVDDNRLICENAVPRLSSIRPDFEQEGYLAAQALARMMSAAQAHPSMRPQTLQVGVTGVVPRDSSAVVASANRLVRRALDYIKAHATDGITVDDVVRHTKVSRRLLYLRFAEETDLTIRGAIEAERLAAVTRLLKTTRLSTDEIAARCGYANPNVLRNLFRKRYGRSMTAFRG